MSEVSFSSYAGYNDNQCMDVKRERYGLTERRLDGS